MSEEEDYDELPPISVNLSQSISNGWRMPSAEEVAEQRARATATDNALRQLRSEHDQATTQVNNVCGAVRSDSSGSEGEAALAAAVNELRVNAKSLPRPPVPRDALPALTAMLPHLPDGADAVLVPAYIDMLRNATDATAQAITDEVLEQMAGMAAEVGTVWTDVEVTQACAWLSAATAARTLSARLRRRALRTLHLLIDYIATDHQVQLLSVLMNSSPLETSTALELTDVLSSGGARAEALARLLAERALAALAGVGGEDSSVEATAAAMPAAWRGLSPAQRYLALQLLARLLAALAAATGETTRSDAARNLLSALAAATPASRNQSTETLKVLVAATKLQLLFHVRK